MWRGWARGLAICGLAVCGGLASWVVYYIATARDQATAGTVAQGVAAALVALAGLTTWLVRRVRWTRPTIDLEQAADHLAKRVQSQWLEAARQRGLIDRPLTVYWNWSSQGVSGPVGDAVGNKHAVRFSPLPGLARITARRLAQGSTVGLFEIYGGLDSGRIILLGEQGSGKSSAMVRLLVDALAYRASINEVLARSTVPVTVLFTAYDWLPNHEAFAAWVIRRLEAEHPYLKARVGKVSAAHALMDAGKISVLIDGLDEVPEPARTRSLREIGRQANCRVVISGRSRELVLTAARGHLDGAAALELATVSPKQAADYLEVRTLYPAPAAWRRVIEYVRTNT